MDKKTITIAVIILVLVVIGAVYFWLGAGGVDSVPQQPALPE